MAKKLSLVLGRGVVVAGVGLSLLRGQEPLSEDFPVVAEEVSIALSHGRTDVARALARGNEGLKKEVFARERAARRAARKERKALAAARKASPPSSVVEKSRKGPPRGYVVRRHLDGRTEFVPVRA